MSAPKETIVACATPPGKGGVAIIRVSGPLVESICQQLFHFIPPPRIASYSKCYSAEKFILDEGLVLLFKAPKSFTGEDIVEFHGHGSPLVINNIIQQIVKAGARLARPGEFSERAFLNNKMDLIQAEAIADLIDAESQAAVSAAMRSLQGEFSKLIHDLVQQVIDLRIYIEAAIDFVDEEIDFLRHDDVEKRFTTILNSLKKISEQAQQGSLLREGINVVIAGEPNVGKSSLLNVLSGKDIAIVTDIAGTTRDVLREHIIIDGLPLHIIDTAGLRDTADLVEKEGIKRAELALKTADLILWLVDATKPFTVKQTSTPTLIIRNKIDLLAETPSISENIISLSVKTGAGVDLLKQAIKTTVGLKDQTEGLFSARNRHLVALNKANEFILKAKQHLVTKTHSELLAEDLRQAQLALNEITGEFSADDLLGRIFSSFCIGK